jgi:hypothetical protein
MRLFVKSKAELVKETADATIASVGITSQVMLGNLPAPGRSPVFPASSPYVNIRIIPFCLSPDTDESEGGPFSGAFSMAHTKELILHAVQGAASRLAQHSICGMNLVVFAPGMLPCSNFPIRRSESKENAALADNRVDPEVCEDSPY